MGARASKCLGSQDAKEGQGNQLVGDEGGPANPKRFINNSSTVVQECLDGLVWSTPNLARLDTYPDVKVVFQSDWDKSKVAIISGGGAGHEPMHGGFVGKGMLTAAISGETFASPSIDSVLSAIVHVTGPKGCLLVIKNYTGDRLNFSLAAERARTQFDLKVEIVITKDDVATVAERGIAGTLFVHKVAGALAEKGSDLDACKNAALDVIENTASMGISFSSVRRLKAEMIGQNNMEVGLGIHGEPGARTEPMGTSAKVVETIMEGIMADKKAQGVRSQGYACIVNNLGSVPPQEMCIVIADLMKSKWAKDIKLLIGPGALCTSLDMNGVSMSLLKLDRTSSELILEPTEAAAWPGTVVPKFPAPVPGIKGLDPFEACKPSENKEVAAVLEKICKKLIASKDALDNLDAKVGDADCGSTMALAATKMLEYKDKLPMASPQEFCQCVGAVLGKVMGGSSGVLMAIMWSGMAHSLKKQGGKTWGTGDQAAKAFRDGLQAMMDAGGAKAGSRTMLDALLPAADALIAGKGFDGASKAAEEGALATKTMRPRAGRSENVPESVWQGVPDPGAQAVALVFKELASSAGLALSNDVSLTAATLRIVQVTDVYTLENFPSLKTLIEEKRAELDSLRNGPGNSKTISMLTGDFLMPYLLSSVDGGRGMMKMLNHTPIDYVTWGNHEADLPHHLCCAREQEYEGVWINTNMQTHESFAKSKCQTDAAFVEVCSADGSNIRKIGMIALLTNSEECYKKGRFNGAVIEDPWECMAKWNEKLKRECDFVLPLCHLYEAQDEMTARRFDFPVVLSGHDHHVVDRVVEGTRILKPGADCKKAVILDITWPTAGACSPVVTAEIVSVTERSPHPDMDGKVEEYYAALKPLYQTTVCVVPEMFRPLSSVGSRAKCNSFARFLNSAIRDALNSIWDGNSCTYSDCDCVIINGGCMPRGECDWPDDEQITLGHLESELKMGTEILVANVPGAILREGLKATWDMGPSASWMQHDDGVEVSADGFVTSICGKPLDPSAIYRVGTVIDFFSTTYAGPVIGKYFEENPSCKPDQDSGFPVEALLLQHWANKIWQEVLHDATDEELTALDLDGDGSLSREELLEMLKSKCGFKADTDSLHFVDQVLSAVDSDGDGQLLLSELMAHREQAAKSIPKCISARSLGH